MNHVLKSLALLIILASCAQHKAQTAKDTQPENATQKMANMSEQEIHEKMQESSTPGTEHARLEPLVGQFVTEAKWWKQAGSKPDITKGSATHQWVLGKRFIKEEFKGKFHGQAFQGLGTLGYDKVKDRYVSSWTDTMSTGIMTATGHYNPETRSIEMHSKYSCPITGKEETSRTVTRILDDKTHVFEMYSPAPDGTEFKVFEITYKKKA